MQTYSVTEGQIVKLFHGRPECAWDIPAPDAQIDRVFHEDMGGNCFWDFIVLKDGRTILVSLSGPIHEENEGKLAFIFPTLEAAYGDGEEDHEERLSVVS